ncbi:MAG: cation transporter [Candidatus Tectimicrobiota bacterium]|nr:MAG: cation transporter [Candidatus Tectomicrobia bacterium]
MAAAARQRAVRRILLGVLGLNWAVAAAKAAYGQWAGLLSMTADGFHSFMDGTSNLLGLLALAVAARPPDASHPYGHRKFETLATVGIAVLLVLAAYEIALSAFRRLGSGALPQVTPLGFAVMLVTLGVNLGVSRYEARRGRELGSTLLSADAQHTRTDVYASLSVLASLAAAAAGYAFLDGLVALVIVGVIVRAALRIFRQELAVLTDAARVDPAVIEKVALSVPGVRACHRIRSRGFEDAITVDCHIWVDPQLPTAEAHRLTHAVMDRIRAEVPGVSEVIVHTEPARPPLPPGRGR